MFQEIPDPMESLQALVDSETDAYFVDDKGWLHTKIVYPADEDLRLGGILTDESGINRTIPDDFGWDLPNNQWGLGSRWRFNMINGYHTMELRLDPNSYEGVQDCADFEEPAG